MTAFRMAEPGAVKDQAIIPEYCGCIGFEKQLVEEAICPSTAQIVGTISTMLERCFRRNLEL
jgi:hypothetical protein